GAAPTSVVSVGAAGAERQITHVAAGRVNGVSTDAINGSQLYATNQAIDTLSTSTNTAVGSLSTAVSASTSALANSLSTTVGTQGQNVADALGGGAAYDPVTGQVKAPTYAMQNADGTTQAVHNVGDALSSINSQGIKYFHANSTGADSQALGTDSVAIGPNAIARNMGDVALGLGSVTSAANPTVSANLGGVTYFFAGSAPTSVVSVGAPGAERQITNVAAGRVSATSTDAINGSQLYATNQAIDSLSTSTAANITSLSTATSTSISSLSTGLSETNNAVAQLSTSTSSGLSSLSTGLSTTNSTVASLSSGVTQINSQLNKLSTTLITNSPITSGIATDMSGSGADGPKVTAGSNSVALGANSNDGGRSNVVSVGSDTQQRQIINVAPGTEGTDAVNVNQLNAVSSTMSTALSGQQSQINSLGSQLQQTDQMAKQGIAAVGAMASIPHMDRDSNFAMGLGTSTFSGQKAFAVGMQARITENLKATLNGGISGSQRVIGAGVLYQWK
ncbi:YadA-like family protein, partial [Burkholderia cenocepacia]|uniref:YadA family autotransporter adhesin n=1 Tax=Burkholderia cenocepacia TaxID=95486 RepID=UPI001B9F19B1